MNRDAHYSPAGIAQGALLIANSKASRALAESILGESLLEPSRNAARAARPEPNLAAIPHLVPRAYRESPGRCLAALLFPVETNAATLKSETVAAWEDYVRTVTANHQDRVRSGGNFLWTFEDAGRAAKVRNGEIVVAPATAQSPKKVPGGLIHHWIGAVILARSQDSMTCSKSLVIMIEYKKFYRPSVVDSKVIARSGPNDEFSMVLMNKSFLLKIALEADYQATNVRLNDRRFYSVSRRRVSRKSTNTAIRTSTEFPKVKAADIYGSCLASLDLEQRDGGVYVETRSDRA